MKAYKCDMCGILYEVYDKNKGTYDVNIIIRMTKDDWWDGSHTLDLCEKCRDKVINMIQNKGV